MSKSVRAALVAGFALVGSSDAGAVREAAPADAPRLELIVVEVESCTVCPLVRAHLLPRWQETGWARRVPMRFVDITRRQETAVGLAAPVDTVPTFVLMRDGREIDRLVGYMGPALFIEAIGHALRREGEAE